MAARAHDRQTCRRLVVRGAPRPLYASTYHLYLGGLNIPVSVEELNIQFLVSGVVRGGRSRGQVWGASPPPLCSRHRVVSESAGFQDYVTNP